MRMSRQCGDFVEAFERKGEPIDLILSQEEQLAHRLPQSSLFGLRIANFSER